MKVLVSAFKPFYKANNNYSIEVLNYINNVDKCIIDVIYDECFEELKINRNLEEYDLIVSLGEARSRSVLTIEKYAKNVSSCSISDNSGIIKQNQKINTDGKDLLETLVDLNKCSDLVELSEDAGKFVCNNLYYHLLEKYPNKSVFIHIPNCNDDIVKYKEYARRIEEIIDILVK